MIPRPILLAAVLIYTNALAQQGSDCDCYHFPITEKCETSCGVAIGTIVSVTNSTVVIAEKGSTSDTATVKKTFALKRNTKKNAPLKEGASATVYYREPDGAATQIDRVDALSTLLLPGDEPDPPLPSSCSRFHPVPPDALRVYLGGNGGYSALDEITVLKVRGIDVVDIRRAPNGLAINAKTSSQDGQIIAEIVDNRFYINPHNFFRMERPDDHSIVVYDRTGRKVLDVRYINSHSIRVLGIFQVPGAPPLIVDENQLSFGGFHSVGSCFAGRTLFQF